MHEYKANRAPIDSDKAACLDCGKPPSDSEHSTVTVTPPGDKVVIPGNPPETRARVVHMEDLRRPDGTAPKNNGELISVMNANALAQDNADLRNQVSELKAMLAKVNLVLTSIQKQQQAMSVTIAQTHGATQDTKTRLMAHMRDEHGLPWLGE